MPRELAMPRELTPAMTPSLLNAALWKVAAVTAVLTPFAIGARIAGAARRALIEADFAMRALAELGIHERPLAIERLGGGRSNAVYKLRFATRTLVLKQGLAEGTLLALAARWVGPQPFARDVSAAARIGREARALVALHAAGVRVPRVVAANSRAGLLLVEHVQGEPLPAMLHRPGAGYRIRAYAAAIRAAHRAGVTLGDGHPGNALVAPGATITLIDLEFAECETTCSRDFAARCAFDVAYASQYFTDDERPVFLAAAIGNAETAAAVRVATDRLADFGALFALERRRQRTPDPDDEARRAA